VKVLLHHLTPDSINDIDIYGRTCLIQAASGGYVECASLLIDNVIAFEYLLCTIKYFQHLFAYIGPTLTSGLVKARKVKNSTSLKVCVQNFLLGQPLLKAYFHFFVIIVNRIISYLSPRYDSISLELRAIMLTIGLPQMSLLYLTNRSSIRTETPRLGDKSSSHCATPSKLLCFIPGCRHQPQRLPRHERSTLGRRPWSSWHRPAPDRAWSFPERCR